MSWLERFEVSMWPCMLGDGSGAARAGSRLRCEPSARAGKDAPIFRYLLGSRSVVRHCRIAVESIRPHRVVTLHGQHSGHADHHRPLALARRRPRQPPQLHHPLSPRRAGRAGSRSSRRTHRGLARAKNILDGRACGRLAVGPGFPHPPSGPGYRRTADTRNLSAWVHGSMGPWVPGSIGSSTHWLTGALAYWHERQAPLKAPAAARRLALWSAPMAVTGCCCAAPRMRRRRSECG